ncbi:putative membrane protein [Roseburia sp. CAG:309]|nr:putative membrane protein [Roseburia sp. CAG:309]
MNLRYCLIAIAVMAVVTYIPRFVPITFFRREIKSVYLKNFLDYTPYAVLGALTFPDIFSSSGNPAAAVVGTAIALILSFFKRGLVVVALGAIAGVYITLLVF